VTVRTRRKCSGGIFSDWLCYWQY